MERLGGSRSRSGDLAHRSSPGCETGVRRIEIACPAAVIPQWARVVVVWVRTVQGQDGKAEESPLDDGEIEEGPRPVDPYAGSRERQAHLLRVSINPQTVAEVPLTHPLFVLALSP